MRRAKLNRPTMRERDDAIGRLIAAERLRSIVSHTVIGVGFPAFVLLSFIGLFVPAAVIWCVGLAAVVFVERRTGDRLAEWLRANGQPVPARLIRRRYVLLGRQRLVQ